MFRIGDFSRFGRVTVKTLRYYDELGLLKPVRVDRFTGYRYYTAEQLPRLYRILLFKEFGFSLEEIAGLLDTSCSGDRIVALLEQKRGEIEKEITEQQARLQKNR